jgi:translocation and assembly module TamB
MQTPLNDPETTASYPRLKGWIKRFYLLFHYLLLLLVLAGAGAVYIVFRADSLEIARTYLLEPLGIRYSHAEGSLRSGFTLHNLRSEGGKPKPSPSSTASMP